MKHCDPTRLATARTECQSPWDCVVVGAGGAGLSAALFAALEGARVLVLESTPFVGGTTAWSAGTSWVPLSRHAAGVAPEDHLRAAREYLDAAVGELSPADLREAFLQQGAAAVECLETRTELHYRPYARHPDYLSDLPGSTLCGRALEPLPLDGRRLGPWLHLLRPPIAEFTVLGGMMVDRTDIAHLLGMTRSWASFRHALRILSRHALDKLLHPRSTRLVMGNALIGRLLLSLMAHERVSLWTQAELSDLGPHADGLRTLEVRLGGEALRVRTRAVILASGGFNRHPERRAQWLPGIPADWSPAAPGHTGQAQDLALRAGACMGPIHGTAAFWAPVSRRQRADGSMAVFPHFVMDRAKPGMITLNAKGERFLNESTSYHLFGLAMQAAQAPAHPMDAWLVADARALRAYGMGMVRPGGKGLAPFLADGYLIEAMTLTALAEKTGMDAEVLQATVRRFNALADQGRDDDFQRGLTAYQQNLGDPDWPGHPNLGPMKEAPFYALRLYPGDIGACTGLLTDAQARLLDAKGQPLPGLYAVGNDMQSIMGGVYPAPGITIGPGMVFAWIATRALSPANGMRS